MAKKLFSVVATISFVVVAVVACTQTNVDVVPSSAKVSYEIVYSNDLLSNETIGQFLPHNAVGVYNNNGLKLAATAPFGFVKTTLVYSKNDFYAAVDIDKAKFLVSFNDFRCALCDSLERNNELTFLGRKTIANYMSEHYHKKFVNEDGICIYVDLFCIPFGANVRTGETASDDKYVSFQDSKKHDISFFITALSLTYDESNVLFLLNDLEGIDNLSPDEFERQNCYVETSINDLIALYRLRDN